MMRRKIWAILSVLLFVVLLSPIEVSAFTPDVDPMFRGIYVEVFGCPDESDSLFDGYFIDVLVLKDEIDGNVTEQGNGLSYPDGLDTNGYGDFDNEWISLSKYYEPGPDIRNKCRVNFFGELENPNEIPYTVYGVVVYFDDSIVASNINYSIDDVSYGSRVGDMILLDSGSHILYSEHAYEDWDTYEPINIIAILIYIVFVPWLFIFTFGEPFIYFFNKRVRFKTWIVLAFNVLALIYFLVLIFTLNQLGVGKYTAPVSIILGVSVVGLVKVLVLYQIEYPEARTSKFLTFMFVMFTLLCCILIVIGGVL